jgi:WD40 repeat protein
MRPDHLAFLRYWAMSLWIVLQILLQGTGPSQSARAENVRRIVHAESQLLATMPFDPNDFLKNYLGVDDIAVSADGELVAFGGGVQPGLTGWVQVVHLRDGGVKFTIERKVYVTDLEFAPAGDTLAVVQGGAIELFKTDGGKQVEKFEGTRSVAYSPDGKQLAVGAHCDTYDHVHGVRLYEMGKAEPDNIKPVRQFNIMAGVGQIDSLYDPTVASLSYSPDGKRLAVYTGFSDDEMPLINRIQVWDVETGKLDLFMPGSMCQFSPDGTWLAYRDPQLPHRDDAVLLNLETFRYDCRLGPAAALAFSADGKWLAVVEQLHFDSRKRPDPFRQTIHVWNFDPAQGMWVENSVLLAETEVTSVALTPDGRQVVSGHRNGELRRWVIR